MSFMPALSFDGYEGLEMLVATLNEARVEMIVCLGSDVACSESKTMNMMSTFSLRSVPPLYYSLF